MYDSVELRNSVSERQSCSPPPQKPPVTSKELAMDMRDSLERDTEGLLPKENLLLGEKSGSLWEDTQPASRCSMLSCRRSPIPIIILCLTNIVTLAVLFYAVQQHPSQECAQLNQPPTGVTPTLAHLVRDPKPELFNVTFYPHDSPFRQRNSVTTDILWENYTVSGKFSSPGHATASLLTPTRSRRRLHHDPPRRGSSSRH